ncbi:hypothetical protein EV132_103282 [Rhizobium sullae]|uniref:Uncharacterized protein n=1 Tax=Rhizobium sullae TaxID=50338 RepID=A0A4R3QEV8_RHISU|nr:hypothetical protein EV132_103282 [Rhizobium sullae]
MPGQTAMIRLVRKPEIAGVTDTFLGSVRNRIYGAHFVSPGLYLDEDCQVALPGDDINLTELDAMAERHDAIALQHQKECRDIFRDVAAALRAFRRLMIAPAITHS